MLATWPCVERIARPVVLVLGLLACGCGSGDSLPKTYPVTGSVADKGGKSLVGGSVQFTPVADASLSVSGAIQDDGTFTLHTIKGKEKLSGAPEGEYKVTILPPISSDQRAILPIELPKPYRVEAKDNQFKFEVAISAKPPR